MKDDNYDEIVLNLDLSGAKFKLLKTVLYSEKLKKQKVSRKKEKLNFRNKNEAHDFI